MNHFTICLNLPYSYFDPDKNFHIIQDLMPVPGSETRLPMRFFPFGICAHMGIAGFLGNKPTPIFIDNNDMVLFFVGRIYNLDELWNSYNHERHLHHDSDTDDESSKYTSRLVLLFYLYRIYGMDYMLQLLDGHFIMALVDQRVTQPESKMFVVGDAMGAMPLYVSYANDMTADSPFFISTQRIHNHDMDIMPMGTYHVYTLPHKIRAQWSRTDVCQYHFLGRSGGGYTLPYLTTNVDNHLAIRTLLLYHLLGAIEKRLNTDPEVTQVVCIGFPNVPNDPEFQVLVRLLTDVCSRLNLPLTCHISVNGEWMNELADVPPTTRIFMSSFLMSTEMGIIQKVKLKPFYSHPSIQYDYEFRRELRSLGNEWLIPKVCEPLQSMLFMNRDDDTPTPMVEFPLLDTSWLDIYLSLGAKYRYDYGMENLLVLEDNESVDSIQTYTV